MLVDHDEYNSVVEERKEERRKSQLLVAPPDLTVAQELTNESTIGGLGMMGAWASFAFVSRLKFVWGRQVALADWLGQQVDPEKNVFVFRSDMLAHQVAPGKESLLSAGASY